MFLYLIVYSGFAQQDSSTLLRFDAGIGFSSMDIDSLDTDPAVLPAIKLFTQKQLNPDLYYLLGGGYTIQGSNNLSPFYKFRLHCISLQAMAGYKPWPNVDLEAGLSGSYLIYSTIITGADSKSRIRMPDYQTGLQANAGAGFRMQNNLYIRGEYAYPINNPGVRQFTISLSWVFSPESIGQKSRDANQEAAIQIAALRNSVLLVRLASVEKKAEALRKQGQDSLATQVIAGQKQKNLEIIRAFHQHFDFCPVYFFYNSETSALLRGEKISFLSDNLEPDQTITLTKNDFFIAEIGNMNPVFEEGEQDLSVLSDVSKYGFVIYNSQLQLPSPPFPYFVKGEDLVTDRTTEQLVWLMNKELHSFYHTVMQGK